MKTLSCPVCYVNYEISSKSEHKYEFAVYADGATLSSDAAWLVPATTTFNAGKHVVAIVAQENLATQPRTAMLTLTSNGISTPITITQAKTNKQ